MHSAIKNQPLITNPQWAWLLLLLFALVILVVNQLSNLDLVIQDYYFDPVNQVFAWKNTWFAKDFMHGYVKKGLITVVIAIISLVVLDGIAPIKGMPPAVRYKLRFVAVAAILVPTVITLIKSRSNYHCPWDVARYGGSAQFFRLLDSIPATVDAGHCFPAGHASTGLWLAGFCVFLLPDRPRIALAVCIAGLGVGFALGWVQQMRGAHFLTHTLASVWIASAVILTMLSFSQLFLNHYSSFFCRNPS